MPDSSCLRLIQQNLQTVIQYSGFHLMGFGEYHDCLELSPNFVYNYLRISTSNVNGTSSRVQTVMGLCLPSRCSKDIIKSKSNQIFKQFQLNSTVQTISNYYPKSLQSPIHLTLYVFLIITLLSVCLSFYATIMIYLNKSTKLKMFSFQSTNKYFKRNPESNLNIFNGVKSLAMLGIIFHHAAGNMRYSINVLNEQNLSLTTFYLIGLGGKMAVATFFFIGGFLTSFSTLKQVWKTKWTVLTNILNRALRILPTYLFILLIYYSCTVHLVKGPNYPSKSRLPYCENIFKTIFFFDNFINNGMTMCLGVSWYLDVDMQMFAISMGLFLLYKTNRFNSKIILWTISLISLIRSMNYSYSKNVKVISDINSLKYQSKWGLDQYFKPWLWISIYFFGIYLGMLYHEYLEQKKIFNSANFFEKSIFKKNYLFKMQEIFQKNKFMRISIELIGIILTNFIIFIPRTIQIGIQWSQFLHSTYLTLAYFIFVLGLSLTILPSILGCKNSIIRVILDNQMFNFMTKISFATYLIHDSFIKHWYIQQSYNIYYSPVSRFVQYIAIAVCSMILSFIITVLIQAPFTIINKNLINFCKESINKRVNKSAINEIKLHQIQQMSLILKTQNNQ